MEQSTLQSQVILRDLGDGLVLRRSTMADADALSEFNAIIHGDFETNTREEGVGIWTRDLLTRPHPTFDPGDFTIVEDARAGKIVSSLNLINQTWQYAGIPFKVGRPELVGTLPEYRKRGLVRAQFDEVHRWSAERSQLVQAITGIPHYYRQFGYEMAVNLGGGKAGYRSQIVELKDGETDPYQVRPAGCEDIPFLQSLYAQYCQRSLLSAVRDVDLWRYELNGRSEANVNTNAIRIIEIATTGQPVAFFAHPTMLWGSLMVATVFEVVHGQTYLPITNCVIRYLRATGEAIAQAQGGSAVWDSFGFWLGSKHPVYDVLYERLPRERKPYAWYLRVADIPGFLRHIRSILERRLNESPMAGYTGEIKISFYRSGLRLVLESGCLKTIESWQPTPVGHAGDAGFPNLTFLQLLFGYHSLEELVDFLPDVYVHKAEVAPLLNSLFPKQSSDIWAIS